MTTPGLGARSLFTTTHWSVVLNAADSSAPGAQEALEKLCRTYWYPLYAYVRRQGQRPADAEDLTQEFFARFLEKKYFQRDSRRRGRIATLPARSAHKVPTKLRHEEDLPSV